MGSQQRETTPTTAIQEEIDAWVRKYHEMMTNYEEQERREDLLLRERVQELDKDSQRAQAEVDKCQELIHEENTKLHAWREVIQAVEKNLQILTEKMQGHQAVRIQRQEKKNDMYRTAETSKKMRREKFGRMLNELRRLGHSGTSVRLFTSCDLT
jgi:hypothetical protein